MRVGFHVSIQGGRDKAVDRAVKLGCNTFQIFMRSPRQWKAKEPTKKEKKAFREKINESHMTPIFCHMPYLSNLASPREGVYLKSVNVLEEELEKCRNFEIPYLITHLGSHLGSGTQTGCERIIQAIEKAYETVGKGVMLLLENMAGTRNSMGSSFENIRQITEGVRYIEDVGVCFDTCHAFAAGYDLRTPKAVEETIKKFEEIIGFEKLKVVHLNDSIGELNSRIDRHEHVGMGKIGEVGFRNILDTKLGQLPLILETPRDSRRDDAANLVKIRELARV